MRIFVSYARVDKPFCVQIVDTLNAHDVWYDQRLYAGQHWWREILRRLDWCEGFIYLLSPESLESQYCQREFELAQRLERHIVPVRIHEDITLPPSLADVQYVDFSKGITPEAVRDLLNSVHVVERENNSSKPDPDPSPDPSPAHTPFPTIGSGDIKPPTPNPGAVIGSAAAAMGKGQFDQAVFLLRQAKANNFQSRFIDIDALLQEALVGLERQSYLREAEREYRQIAPLVKEKHTRKLGCQAFMGFKEAFPDYDPDNLTSLCQETPSIFRKRATTPTARLPGLEWCEIPAGNVRVDANGQDTAKQQRIVYVDAFSISKYPVTNAQYQKFLDDPNGYTNPQWWRFSPCAASWHQAHPDPAPSQFEGDERPREMVNWYNAMAFCFWASDYSGTNTALPTETQWLRAARGDDDRVYPWGDKFDKDRCNTSESNVKMTSLVMRFPTGASPFGVYDMSGNVWEWCLNTKADLSNSPEITSDSERVVHGGSYIGPSNRAKIPFRYYLNPHLFYASIGFRIVKTA